ncbi:MAG: hypothetical protein AAF634_05000 [Bacteroidota bacterium]
METIPVDINVYRKMLAKQRQDIRKGIGTTTEVLEVLGISKRQLAYRVKHNLSKLTPSTMKGKWIWSSVKEEFKDIHGVKYEDAIR